MLMRYSDLKQCNEVVISNHAFRRWNTRVGPVLDDINILVDNLNKLIKETDRFEIADVERDCIYIDDDIVAVCSIKKKKLCIDSFLGRISMRPSLGNFEALSNFMLREGTRSEKRYSDMVKTMGREGIDLNLTKTELLQMTMPQISDHVKVVKALNYMFKLTLWKNQVEVKQLTGNVGIGQRMSAPLGDIHHLWIAVQPNSLSHFHLAELSVQILDFIEESKQRDCFEDCSVI